jgi:hypothetical protein
MDHLIASLARTQRGLITRAQALDAGFTRRMIGRRIGSGRWLIVAPGVYCINGTPPSWEGRMLAACLSAGPDAVVSHRSAAALWALEGFAPPGIVELAVPRHLRHRRRAGVRLHETLDYQHIGTVSRLGVPTTGAARTVLDLCAVLDDELDMLRALDDVIRRRLATWPDLWECLVLHARRGRNGVAPYRVILQKRWGRRPPYRQFARLVLKLIEDAGLPTPVAEHPVRAGGARYYLDLAYPDLKIAIECDGKESHFTDAAFEYDPVRRNRLELDGWIVLDYTWTRLIAEPYAILAEIRAAIALRTSPSGVR